MKRRCMCVWAAVAAAAVAYGAEADKPRPMLEAGEDPVRYSLGLLYRTYFYEHDALQQRWDKNVEPKEDWRNGESDGQGPGIRLAARRGDALAELIYVNCDIDYSRDPGSGFSHRINTTRHDVEFNWWQTSGSTEKAYWGWVGGLRYTGSEKEVTVVEKSKKLYKLDNVNWYMLSIGYFGDIRPLEIQQLRGFGSLNGLLGEASGMARMETDNGWDGKIAESYDTDYSLAYGANLTLGIGWSPLKNLELGIHYRREWLYSFEATGTGMTMFPDNGDARFIESTYGLQGFVTYTF